MNFVIEKISEKSWSWRIGRSDKRVRAVNDDKLRKSAAEKS
jgi:hypothetical protein